VAELVGDDDLFVEELLVVVVWQLVVEENAEVEVLIRYVEVSGQSESVAARVSGDVP
jgi:hypothetical protein